MKNKMSNRELLMNVLSGEPVDRVPIWLLYPYHPLGCYVDVQTTPGYRDIFEASKEVAVMLNRRGLGVPAFAPSVVTATEECSDGDWQVRRSSMKWSDVNLCSEHRCRDDETRIKKLLSSEEELEQFCRLPVNTDEQEIEQCMEKQLAVYLREKEEFPEEYGAMMLDLGEPIGSLYGNSELTEYPVWSLTHDEMIVDYLDRQMQRLRSVYRFCLERDLADVYFLVGSELASPPLVSRQTFQKWIVPYAKELIDIIHSYGKKAIQHYHGQIREILPDFLTMGPDGLHTIEAPPVGDCTMAEAFATVGDSMALIGNVQYDCFRSHTSAEMEQEVRLLIDECRGRRFILSPSAGPFDEQISERIRENYMTFMKTGYEYGQKEKQ